MIKEAPISCSGQRRFSSSVGRLVQCSKCDYEEVIWTKSKKCPKCGGKLKSEATDDATKKLNSEFVPL